MPKPKRAGFVPAQRGLQTPALATRLIRGQGAIRGMNDKPKQTKPEWAPDAGGPGFSSRYVPGHAGRGPGRTSDGSRRPPLDLDELCRGVLAGRREALGRAITLVESNAPAHLEKAQELLARLAPHTGGSVRVGITGFPGAGKSSLIDALGEMLCQKGHRVAVLAVDPSSQISGGSILGDKTRMEALAKNAAAFIRPSPTGGVLGGVARKSRESIQLCEAAGFDVILVETVGVGQSEVMVRSMVDFFALVTIAGAGDELQGIKRGVMELADAVLVNKADGDGVQRALAARAELERALGYLMPASQGWRPPALALSARTREGLDELWRVIQGFVARAENSGAFARRRREQRVQWMRSLISQGLEAGFAAHPGVKELLPGLEDAVARGDTGPTQAARLLLEAFGVRPFA